MGRNRKRKRRLREIMGMDTSSSVESSTRKHESSYESAKKKKKKKKKKNSNKTVVEDVFDYKKRTRVLPTEYATTRTGDSFVTKSHKEYEQLIKTSYEGFCVDEASMFPLKFHDEFKNVFECLETDQVFLYDVTQPRGLGTPCARTFVKRTLLGIPGITYKYLGLRMFAIPWTESYRTMEKLNRKLVERTKMHLSTSASSNNEPKGSCEYNLTLINRMEPLSNFESELKDEPMFKKEKCSVSWHADSTLQHFSSIAVYHRFYDDGDVSKKKKPWKIALRIAHDAEGPTRSKRMTSDESKTPAVSIDLPNESAYYMMDSFNHHHQHAVIAGDSLRYASTHRVCRLNGHTVQSVLEKCLNVLNRSGKRHTLKQWRSEQSLLDEIEFEWIRQWYVQGKRHAEIRKSFWQEQIDSLVKMWKELESRTKSAFELLRHAVEDIPKIGSADKSTIRKFVKKRKKALLALEEKHQVDHLSAYDLLIECISEREKKRGHWKNRYDDVAFHKVPKDCRPLPLPIFLSPGETLGETLSESLRKLCGYRALYAERGQ